MEDLWDAAIKEAYNVSSDVILSTLELYHSSWSNPEYVVNDTEDLSGYIESSSSRNPNTLQTFLKCAFAIKLPDSSEGLPEMEITIDNVSAELMPQVLLALGNRSPVHIVYREYLKEDATSGPHYILKGLYLNSIICTDSTLTGTAVFGDYSNRMFPNKVFTASEYPGLERS